MQCRMPQIYRLHGLQHEWPALGNDRQFDAERCALIACMCFLDNFHIDALDLTGQLINFRDFLVHVLTESIRNGDITSAVIQLHGVLQ